MLNPRRILQDLEVQPRNSFYPPSLEFYRNWILLRAIMHLDPTLTGYMLLNHDDNSSVAHYLSKHEGDKTLWT